MIGLIKGTMRNVKSVPGLPAPIASFKTNVGGYPLEIVSSVEAVQSGSGDPYPPGGGKNKCNAQIRTSSLANGITSQVYADNRITASGQSTGNGDIGINLDTDLVLDSGKSYTISLTGTVTRTSALPTYLRVKGGSYTSPVSMPVGSDYVTLSNISGTFDRILIRVTNTQTISMDAKIQIEEGSSPTSYAPFSNIRPFSGWSGAVLWNNGSSINQWDEQWEQGGYDNSGNKTVLATVIRNKYPIRVQPETTYYFHRTFASGTVRRVFWDKNFNCLYSQSTLSGNTSFTTPENAVWMGFNTDTAYGGTYRNDISINSPSTDTDYHAYFGTTYLLQFGQELYGAVIDWKTGVATVICQIEDLGNLSYTKYDVAEGTLFRTQLSGAKLEYNVNNLLCEIYHFALKEQRANGTYSIPDNIGNLDFVNNSYSDAIAFKTAMAGQKLLYELTTPFDIQLTPTVITQLKKQNIIWCDSGNIDSVKYSNRQIYYGR